MLTQFSRTELLLGKVGMEQYSIDLGVSRSMYKEKVAFYNPTPMFAIAAIKGSCN